MINKLNNLRSNVDEDDDEIYDLENELFNKFIEMTGLYVINSLHADSYDEFKNKFLFTLNNN